MRETGPPSQRLGDLLVQAGLITTTQRDLALAQQRSTGQMLGVILIGMGAITEDTLLDVFSQQYGLPRERVDLARVDWRVAAQFPPSMLAEGTSFPLRADERSVTIAITNPLNAWALNDVERSAGQRVVKRVLVRTDELRALHQEHTRRTLRALEARLKQHGHA
jgi:type IV pilus assembly protein PilB